MAYNFDEIIDRQNTNSLNTDGFRGYIFHAGPEKQFPYKDDEFIRMWIADMEFAVPEKIRTAIKNRVDRQILGYTMMFKSEYYRAFSTWCNIKYNWTPPAEEIVFSTGVIPALYQLVELLVPPGEKILLNTPAYGYFQHAAEYNNIEYVESPLLINNGEFSIDFEDLERQAARPDVNVLIWCNPHNPTGRVWTKSELIEVGSIVRRHKLWLISDEIHCDLLRSGLRHTPMASIMGNYDKIITCMSASKTFNMAGLMFSDIIIKNKELREKFVARDKNAGMLNPLSIVAHQAAYDYCGPWLTCLRQYLDGNFQYLEDFLREKLPQAVFVKPDATYLAWVNLSACLPGIEDMSDFFANNAGVLLEGGDNLFVGNAQGYVRLNMAMPQSIIAEGLDRMYRAIEAYNNK